MIGRNIKAATPWLKSVFKGNLYMLFVQQKKIINVMLFLIIFISLIAGMLQLFDKKSPSAHASPSVTVYTDFLDDGWYCSRYG